MRSSFKEYLRGGGFSFGLSVFSFFLIFSNLSSGSVSELSSELSLLSSSSKGFVVSDLVSPVSDTRFGSSGKKYNGKGRKIYESITYLVHHELIYFFQQIVR